MRLSFFLFTLPLLIACGGSDAGVDDWTTPSPSPNPSGSSSSGAPDPNAPNPSGTNAPPDPGGPRVTITMHGSTASFAHKDGFAGQTPRKQIVAVKSLYLLRTANDPNPVKVFDHGDKAVEVELVSGKPVELATIAAKSLPAGVFTMAKSGASYVKYAVDARMHSGTVYGAIDGHYDNVQALSEGAVIDGVKKKKGDFRYSFIADATGATLGSLEGENAPTPVATTSGGIGMDMSGPETFYVFPINMAVDPNVATDQVVDFELNVDKSFRWVDQSQPGYTTGTYDTTPTQFEPVMAFGANAFNLTVKGK
jgi:hypothetical protein